MNNNIMQINFSIDKQSITRTDSNKPVENSKNYLIAKFTFSSDWDNTTKVLFVQYENRYYNLVDIQEDNTAKIPDSVIHAKGFKLAVQGKIGDQVVITTNTIGIPVIETVYFEGDIPYIKYIESETLIYTKDGDLYKLEIPDIYGINITLDNPSDGIIRLKNRAGETLGQVDLPVEKHIKGARLDLEGKKLVFIYEDETTFDCDISDMISDYSIKIESVKEALDAEIKNREKLTGHSIKISQAKEHIIDIDLINANGESVSHQEINLDDEHIIDKVNLDYENKKLIFTFKDGHTIDCDLTDMIKDLQDEITKVNARIDALDYYNAKLDGDYIDGITQTGGLISATKKSFDTVLTDTSVIAPQSKAVKIYVDSETLRAETVEDSLGNDIASLSDDLSDVNSRLNSEILRANQSEAQIQAKLEIETGARKDADDILQTNISNETTRAKDVENKLDTRVSTIESKIPNQASSSNQLADKDFVNSSISTATATFRGTVNTIAELKALSGDLNDYAWLRVIDTTTGLVKQFDKYKYTDTASAETGNWEYEYTLNNSSFTEAQWKAINSGATEEIIAQMLEDNKKISWIISCLGAWKVTGDNLNMGYLVQVDGENLTVSDTMATVEGENLVEKVSGLDVSSLVLNI